jgi:amino acid transporter
MSRDGLLPKRFSKVHPKFKTPSFATIVVGFVVAVPALFMNLTMVTDLCSIGTLFAFVLVCGGVLVLQNKQDVPRGKFKTPYINGKYFMPLFLITGITLSFIYNRENTVKFLSNEKEVNNVDDFAASCSQSEILKMKNYFSKIDKKGFLDDKEINGDVFNYLNSKYEKGEAEYVGQLEDIGFNKERIYSSGFTLFKHKIPFYIFLMVTIWLTVISITKNLSLIPTLGLVSCLYMMSQLSLSNWIGFGVWLLVGLIIYFGYSRRNSKLNVQPNQIASDLP